MTDGSCTCEHNIKYKVVKSLCCTQKTSVTLFVNYISNRKKKISEGKKSLPFLLAENNLVEEREERERVKERRSFSKNLGILKMNISFDSVAYYQTTS